ncbi:MAG: MoxR family ATPase [Desulfobacterales bacterium]
MVAKKNGCVMAISYQKLFDPESATFTQAQTEPSRRFADRTPNAAYVYADEIVLAVNVAMATGRPLLIRGPSGSGKSSLAMSVAENLRLNYVEAVVTSRTQARDLQWQVDLLKRLQDAQARQLSADWRTYVTPGPLWWAFEPNSAKKQMIAAGVNDIPKGIERFDAQGKAEPAVLLIDEIDKADPDVPNNLLKPLGELRFVVEELGLLVETEQPPLVFITTNDERDLPSAFLRRCVELVMPSFTFDRLAQVGRAHFDEADTSLLNAIANFVLGNGGAEGVNPNAAEYLDIVRACLKLDIRPDTDDFKEMTEIVLMKQGRRR